MRSRTIARALAGLLFGLALVAPAAARAEPPCTLMEVSDGATLVVYFTKFPKEDQTGGRYAKCRLVKKKGEGTVTFKVTPFRPDATIVVHRSNWPK